MPILTLNLKLPSEFVATATVGTSSDWLIIQKSGETEVSKIAAVPAAVGAAPAGGALATSWECNNLRSASGYLYAQASGGDLLSSIAMYNTGVADRMVFRNEAGFQFYGALTGTTLGPIYAGDIYQNGTQILAATGWGGTPSALGSASAGTATTVARSDHVHPLSGGSTSTAFATAALTTKSIQPDEDSTYTIGVTANRYYRGWFDELYIAGGAVTTSDERQKIDIKDSDLGLAFVRSLRPISYRLLRRAKKIDDQGEWRQSQGVRRHYGLSAQQCKSVLGDKDFAGYIDVDRTGEELGLRYSEFIAPLISAIQELSDQVATLSIMLEAAEAKAVGETGVWSDSTAAIRTTLGDRS